MTNLDSILKSRDITFPTKFYTVKAMVFPVFMYGCESFYKESWVPKNWCFWIVLLEKILQSLLDCKEIQPVNPKGNQSWIFIERTDVEAKTPIPCPPDGKNWFIWKDSDAGKDWGQEEKGMTEDEMVGWHHWLDASGSWWRTGKPGVLQFIGSQSSVQFKCSVLSDSLSLSKLISIELVMQSNHLILCHPLLLLPSIFPSIRVFSDESALRIRWPEYWSFSFSISPSNEHWGLISFRMDWLDLLAVQGTLKSLLQHHSSKASILCSVCSIVQLSHPYMTTGKTIALTRWTFVDEVMSLLFNILSRLVISFLSRSSVF